MQRYEIYLNRPKIPPPVQQFHNRLRHNVKMWQIVQKPLPHLPHIYLIGITRYSLPYRVHTRSTPIASNIRPMLLTLLPREAVGNSALQTSISLFDEKWANVRMYHLLAGRRKHLPKGLIKLNIPHYVERLFHYMWRIHSTYCGELFPHCGTVNAWPLFS